MRTKIKIKIIIHFVLCTLLNLSILLTGIGCNSTVPPTNTEPDTTPPEDPTTPPPADNGEPEHIPTDFELYPSNILATTSHNTAIYSPAGTMELKTYRCVFTVQEYGEFDYKLFFSNAIDSTQGNTYRNMPTKEYRIDSAYLGVVTEDTKTATCSNMQRLTFDGSKNKIVAPNERFWSDPITVNVGDGEMLMFEWTVQYEMIPAIVVSPHFHSYTITYDDTGKVKYVMNASSIPTPDLVGCNREVEHRIAFMGDSITQGTGAAIDMGWVAQVAKGLGPNVASWNIGLGGAKADDVKDSPSWIYKASQYDTVVLCFGVNDINTGAYQSPRGQTVQEIYADIREMAKILKDAGCNVVIFTTPPYTYHSADRFVTWDKLCEMEETLAKNYHYGFFDFAEILVAEDGKSPAYGKSPQDGHVNTEGCTLVAEAILRSGVLNKPEKE